MHPGSLWLREAHPLRRPCGGTVPDSRRSWAISCKASAYFVNSLATHVRATRSSHALIAFWASRETDSTVRRPEAAPATAEPAVGDADRPSKDCAEAEIGPPSAAERARATARLIVNSQERLKRRPHGMRADRYRGLRADRKPCRSPPGLRHRAFSGKRSARRSISTRTAQTQSMRRALRLTRASLDGRDTAA